MTLTPEDLVPYRAAVDKRICSFCNDHAHGKCTRPADDPCALHAHLDLIVESILGVAEHPEVAPYVAALRTQTCPHCRQDEAGRCSLRDQNMCAPDAYIIPLIEVIEDVARERGHGKWAAKKN